MTEGNRKKGARKAIGKWIRRILGILFVIGVAAMLVTAWLPKPVAVDLVDASEGSLQVTVDEDGRTRVKDRYVVSAPLSGNVARMELRPGDTIEAGALLARIVPIDPPLMDARSVAQAEARVAGARAAQRQSRSTISRAQASLEFAEQEATRQQALQRGGASSQAALDQAELSQRTRREELTSARFAAQVADYEVRVAEAALGRLGGQRRGASEPADEQLEVVSPVAGRILRVYQESEGVVQAGAPLVEIGDPAALEIAVDVLTNDAVHIETGSRVIIDRWGGPSVLDGRVRVIEPSAFTRMSALGVEEQRVNVIVDILDDHSTWQALGDGYRVEAQIVIWAEEDVLKVPSNAVFRHEAGWAVYRSNQGVAELTEVEVGRDNGLQTHILSGLSASDTVVAHPGDAVRDGVELAPR